MQLSRLLFFAALLATPLALVGTTWLFYYPLFNRACNFPEAPHGLAPFRLLALGDPQLEGDSSLPKPGAPIFPSLQNLLNDTRHAGSWPRRWYFVKEAGGKMPKDFLRWLEGHRKRIDIWGNDYYLGHIVRTLRWWAQPSHVVVLGDLLGSQWIKDEEFERRSRRYWDIVMSGMDKVPDHIMAGEGAEGEKKWGGTVEVLGSDKSWDNRVINIAGNHDIGYAGDIDDRRIERFENMFGKVNWDITFTLPRETGNASASDDISADEELPALRLVMLNSMNLDTPAFVGHLQRESYDFMNHVISTSRSVNDKTHATILLTHIPFNKEAGTCVDAPLFHFFDGGSGVKEQNMLSDYVTKIMLEGIFGLSSKHEADGKGFGRRGIILNGHDHEGCDVLHYITQPGVPSQCPEDIQVDESLLPELRTNASTVDKLAITNTTDETIASESSPPDSDATSGSDTSSADTDTLPAKPEDPKWQALRIPHPPYRTSAEGECTVFESVPHIREVTVRSMMGEFGGYAGFLSAWFDPSIGEKGEWKMEFNTCGMGTQHWWWGVYITDLILVVAVVGGVVARWVEGAGTVAQKPNKAGQANGGVVKKSGIKGL